MQRSFAIGVFLILFFIIDLYIFFAAKGLIKSWSELPKRIFVWAYWSVPAICLGLFIVTFFVLGDRLSYKYKNFIGAFIFIIYISKIFTAFILLIGDLWRLLKWAWFKISNLFQSDVSGNSLEEGQKIGRSEFLTKAALAVGGTHVAAMTFGIISGAYDYRIRRVALHLPNLPKSFHGLKLIQLSDIHSGSFYNKTAVQGGVDMLLAEKPDLVFFTGDLVNNKAEELKDYFDIFKKVKAPLGVYSTFGNHDYGDYTQWASLNAKQQNLKDLAEGHRLMNWNLLLDENKKITVDGESIGVLGIQNWGKGFAQYGNLDKTLIGTDEYPVNLLLSHDPSHWREQVLGKTNIDVAFAGHTHGMQYGVEIGGLKWSPVQWRYKEWAGLYEEGGQHLYVNRGYGFLGYPGRLGILPEITVFELKTHA